MAGTWKQIFKQTQKTPALESSLLEVNFLMNRSLE